MKAVRDMSPVHVHVFGFTVVQPLLAEPGGVFSDGHLALGEGWTRWPNSKKSICFWLLVFFIKDTQLKDV